MSRAAGEQAFLARLGTGPAGGASLVRGAVLLARTQCPDADPDRVEAMIGEAAVAIRRKAAGDPSALHRARALGEVLAGERGLRGDRGDYDDPRNSCLECVLDRRLGVPLALSLLWMEAGRRAGWTVEGVGLPGHFVVRVHGAKAESVLADPFHGGVVRSKEELKDLLQGIHGKSVPLRPRDLQAMQPLDVLLRMLRNLRNSYRKRGDRARAIAVADDMLLLVPGLPEALRDRGLLRLEGGERRGGLADLRAFLAHTPRASDADAILRLVTLVTDNAEMPN